MVGSAYMCSREKEFTIRGTENCLARGYDRTGFFEVDTGEQRSWTVQLTESAEQAPRSRCSRVPLGHARAIDAAAGGLPPPCGASGEQEARSNHETFAPRQDRCDARDRPPRTAR